MNSKDRALKYLIARRQIEGYTSIMDIPILILVWELHLITWFWILLAILILNGIISTRIFNKLEQKAGLKELY